MKMNLTIYEEFEKCFSLHNVEKFLSISSFQNIILYYIILYVSKISVYHVV